jgi:drug/metabolite transporter (DMT)-like permease
LPIFHLDLDSCPASRLNPSGAAALIAVGLLPGRVSVLSAFGPAQWIAGICLGVAGGALAFILWVLALERTTPTRMASTMTVNPIAVALLANQIVGEPITLNLVIGLVAVFAGIWIATTEPRTLVAGQFPAAVATIDPVPREKNG